MSIYKFNFTGIPIGRKGFARGTIYLLLLSFFVIYIVFFSQFADLISAASYFPIGGNLCAYNNNTGINNCATVGLVTNCTSGKYRPAFSCQASDPTCIAETGAGACGAACTDCNGAGTCVSKTCADGNNYGCASGSYCNNTGSCNAKLANGQSCADCSLNVECTSGNCANGGATVCCDSGYRCCSTDANCLTNTACDTNYDCKYGVPLWSNNVSVIPVTYSAIISTFNITWTPTNFTVDKVLFESNFSGISTNYTMTQLATNIYNYNLTLPAGTFYWKSYANSTKNLWNSTPQWTFKINTIIIILNSYRTNSVNQIIARPNSNILLYGTAYYKNGTVFANSPISFNYSTVSLGSNNTDASGNYVFSFTIPYTGNYTLIATANDAQGITGYNTSVLYIAYTPVNVKYRLSYHFGTSKSDDVESTGNYNETVDSLSVSRFFYSSNSNLAHAYTCTYDNSEISNGQLLSLIHSYQRNNLNYVNFTASAASDYTLELSQKIGGSSLLLAYTRGTCNVVDSSMYLVENNQIPSRPFSSFSFGAAKDIPLLIRAKYDKIMINGSDVLDAGTNVICVSNDATAANNYPIVTVKRC